MLRKINLIDFSLLFLVFCLLFVGYFHTVTAMTQDLGRHFLLGRIILETGSIPLTNLFSYTYPDFPFINLHWLSEVIFYLIFQLAGFPALQILTLATVTLAFGLIFFFSLKRGSFIPVTLVSMLYLKILFERTDIRPEIFSFLFTAAFIVILYRYRERFTKWIFLLIPLELLWVNMHIYFIIGALIIGLFLIDTIIAHRRNLYSKYTSILVIVFCATLLVMLVSPNGIKGATYPFRVFENYGYTIEENQSIFLLESLGFQKPSIGYFKIAVLLLFGSLLFTAKNTRVVDWLLCIAFTVLGASAVRNLPLFVFTTFIPFTLSLSRLSRIGLVQHAIASVPPVLRTRRMLAGVLLLLLLWQIYHVATLRVLGFGAESGAERAADFFLAQNLQGPLFNNFDIGSYLDYRLYPKERVFIDGRPGEYPAVFFTDVYIPMQEKKELFAAVDEQYGFNTIFFAHTDQTPWAKKFLRHIVENENWTMVYLDDYVVILLKEHPKNVAVIKRFAMTENTAKISNYDPQNLRSLQQAASFFNKVGWIRREVDTYQAILKIDPGNCPVLYNLSAYYVNQQNPAATILAQKYSSACH